jgi:hypothetical protein
VKAVNRAAKAVSFFWPDTVIAEDLAQDLWIEILESPATLKAVSGADPSALHTLLMRLGHRAAGKERDDYDHFRGNFNYSVDDVKRLLSRGALEDDVFDPANATHLDLEAAMGVLWETAPQHAESLTTTYSEGWEVPRQGAEQLVRNRALTSLTTGMNRSFKQRAAAHDGPGTRAVISNATARAITEV